MESVNHVLLVTQEPATAERVCQSLKLEKYLDRPIVCSKVPEMANHLSERRPQAALVDIGPDPRRMLAELEPVIAQFPETRFVVLSTELEQTLVLEAMRIGARDFLVKSQVNGNLVAILRRLVSPDRGRSMDGAIVTILGAAGGAGATTVAINLANELAMLSASPSLIVDMDRIYSEVGRCLGVRGQYGLADVLSHESGIDAELVRSTILTPSTSLHVLGPGKAASETEEPPRYDQFGAVLDLVRRSYAFTVVDAARVPLRVAAALTAASRCTLLVFQLTLKDLTMVRSVRQDLIARGASSAVLLPLVNRHGKHSSLIGLDEVRKILGVGEVRCLRNDYSASIRSLNHGKPLAETSPRSPLRKDLQQLASEILSFSATPAPAANGRAS